MEKKSNNSLESWKKSISNYNKCIYSFTHSTEIYEAVLRWQEMYYALGNVFGCVKLVLQVVILSQTSVAWTWVYFSGLKHTAGCFWGGRAESTIVHLVTQMQLSQGSAMFGMLVVTGVEEEREGRSHFFRVLAQKCDVMCTSAYSPILELVTWQEVA